MNGQKMFERLSRMSEEDRVGMRCFGYDIDDVKTVIKAVCDGGDLNDAERDAVGKMSGDDMQDILDSALNEADFDALDAQVQENIKVKIMDMAKEA